MRERRLKQAIEIQNGVISPFKQPGFNDRQVRVQIEQLQGSGKRSPREEPARTEKQKELGRPQRNRGISQRDGTNGGKNRRIYSSVSVRSSSLRRAFAFS
jgi:hypothetical protein